MDGSWVLSELSSSQPHYLLFFKDCHFDWSEAKSSVVSIYISLMASKAKTFSSFVLLGLCVSSPENCVFISLIHFLDSCLFVLLLDF